MVSFNIIVGDNNPDTLDGPIGVRHGTAGNDLIIGPRRQRHAQWPRRQRHPRLAATATTRSMAATATTSSLAGRMSLRRAARSSTISMARRATLTNNGTLSFNGAWTESGGEPAANQATTGDILISGNRLRFQDEHRWRRRPSSAPRTSLPTTRPTLSFAWEGDDLDGGENVSVQAFNGTTWDTLATLGGDDSDNFSIALTAAQIGAHTAIRFVANGTYETGGELLRSTISRSPRRRWKRLMAAMVTTPISSPSATATMSSTTGQWKRDRISITSAQTPPATPIELTGLNFAETTTGTQQRQPGRARTMASRSR